MKKIIEKNIDDLIFYEFNNKIHSEKQIDLIANSIKEYWFLNPIIIDKNNIIVAWHWRLLWAKKLWLKLVPCIIADQLTEIQIKKYRILDNRLADLSEYNFENLKLELNEIDDVELKELFIELKEFKENENSDLDLWSYNNSQQLEYLVFWDVKIILDQDELNFLKQKYEQYYEDTWLNVWFIKNNFM